MNGRVVVLGAGFGGLELSTMLSEASGGDLDLTLIDRSDSFVRVTTDAGTHEADALGVGRLVEAPGSRRTREGTIRLQPLHPLVRCLSNRTRRGRIPAGA